MTYSNDNKRTSQRVLVEMLTSMRPAGSKSERRFIREYILPLGVEQDKAGNLIKRIGDAPVMWSCHTDTVHRQGGKQLVTIGDGMIQLAATSTSNCLGADDTAGVWLMTEMILANRPGLYVFHRGEEIGGVGSSHIASRTPRLADGILAAIALDRAGTQDVITHQGNRCCSDVFAASLAGQLGMGYRPDDTGVFTDTANYVDIIGECTNLSVGYYHQHRAKECLDATFLTQLRDTLLTLDTRDLTYSRKSGERDPLDYGIYGLDYGPRDKDLAAEQYKQTRMSDMVRDFPEEVADILEAFGMDGDTLIRELELRHAF
jgi:hypothetical protein